jgi:superfamily II helicase
MSDEVRAAVAERIRASAGGVKTCRHCRAEKPYEDFPRNPKTRDQASSWCKSCHNEAKRRHRAARRPA